MRGKVSHSEDNIRKAKYITKVALQYSQILFNLQKYKKSLKLANCAYKYSCKAILDTLAACKKQHSTITSKPKREKYTKTEKNKIFLTERALPTLEAIQDYLKKGVLHKVDMRSALGLKGQPE